MPVIVGTVVFAGSSDGNLYAFDTATGTFLWQLDTGAPIITDLVTADGAIYFANQNDSSSPPKFTPSTLEAWATMS